MNKVVEQILRTIDNDIDTKWVSKLNFVEFAINSLVNASTGTIHFELVYRQQVQNIVEQLGGLHRIEGAQQMVDYISKLVEQAKDYLLQAQESQTKYYDKHHRPITFMVTDKEFLSTKKLQFSGLRKFQQRFVGPIMVLEYISSQAYRLQLLEARQQLHNIFHVSLLKPYVARGNGVEQPKPIIIDGEPEWKFEDILYYRHRRGIKQYLVKYAGYDQNEAMWLDEADLVNAPDILANYKTRMG